MVEKLRGCNYVSSQGRDVQVAHLKLLVDYHRAYAIELIQLSFVARAHLSRQKRLAWSGTHWHARAFTLKLLGETERAAQDAAQAVACGNARAEALLEELAPITTWQAAATASAEATPLDSERNDQSNPSSASHAEPEEHCQTRKGLAQSPD